jgi:sugar/nucleoside kinase (ribokinase family)
MDKNLIGIGNAAIDGTVEISSDTELKELGLVKGTCVFVDGQDERMKTIFDRYPDYQKDPGGAAANTIAAYGALGGTARFIGKTGMDEYGEFFTNDIKKYGVTFETAATNEVESTFLFSVITPDRERSFLSNHGASHKISAADVKEKWFTKDTSLIMDGYMLMSGGGPEAMFTAMDYAEKHGSEIVFMPCSLTVVLEKRDYVDQICKRAHAFIANREEADAIAGGDYKDIQSQFDWGVVTLSADGAWYFDNRDGTQGHVPTPYQPDRIENTNGAGDNFSGGLLYGLHHGMDMKDAVMLGHKCAIHVLQKRGARSDYDIRHLLEE